MTADFIVAMTESVIHGFNTACGMFSGLPANKVVIGLPACSGAAVGGYADTATVKAAINYLRGTGAHPGSSTLAQVGGYPTLRGMITWSINWDAVNTCATTYQYAENYEIIFGFTTSVSNLSTLPTSFDIYPNPAINQNSVNVKNTFLENVEINFYTILGEIVLRKMLSPNQNQLNIETLSSGVYWVTLKSKNTNVVQNY